MHMPGSMCMSSSDRIIAEEVHLLNEMHSENTVFISCNLQMKMSLSLLQQLVCFQCGLKDRFLRAEDREALLHGLVHAGFVHA